MKTMKKNQKHENQEHDIEIIKAVAQAWHGHSISSKTTTETSEFDARRLYFKRKPTRFRLEALRRANKKNQWSSSWDFRKSLWDSYEILAVSKKLERGLVMEDPFSELKEKGQSLKRKKESKNSLRNLFNRMSSKRFTEDDLPSEID